MLRFTLPCHGKFYYKSAMATNATGLVKAYNFSAVIDVRDERSALLTTTFSFIVAEPLSFIDGAIFFNC